ncbi:hypothetical protein B0H12DRAFT_1238051 [Mycena haematopus]|nr:hypothetical protein B0H12DRAFT_1238051 [Mycena haematopus]
MPAGRPRLDAETKRERLLLSRKRYEEKNAAKRREAARVGMTHHREAMAASDYKTRSRYRAMVSGHSDSYRARKAVEIREERVAADAVKGQARKTEASALREKHRKLALSSVPPAPTKAAKPAAKSLRPRALIRLTTPTPAPRRAENSLNTGRAAVATNSADKSSEDDDGAHPCVEQTWPNDIGPLYAIVCKDFRGVVDTKERRAEMQGLYPEARTWAAPDWPTFTKLWALDCREYHDHQPSDFTPPPSPTPPSSPSSWNPTPSPSPERAPLPSPSPVRTASPVRTPPPSASLCRAPSPVRTMPLVGTLNGLAHSPPCKLTMARLARLSPYAQGMDGEGCEQFFSKSPVGPSAPEKRAAPARAPPTTPQVSPKKPTTRAPPLTKDDLAHLASFRNASFSPRRLEQQFLRVLGPASVMQPLPRELSAVAPRIVPVLAVARESVPVPSAPAATTSTPHARNARETPLATPTLDRAVKAFKGTPGADLLITRDEDEAFEFIGGSN